VKKEITELLSFAVLLGVLLLFSWFIGGEEWLI
jgi:hypothetical protein